MNEAIVTLSDSRRCSYLFRGICYHCNNCLQFLRFAQKIPTIYARTTDSAQGATNIRWAQSSIAFSGQNTPENPIPTLSLKPVVYNGLFAENAQPWLHDSDFRKWSYARKRHDRTEGQDVTDDPTPWTRQCTLRTCAQALNFSIVNVVTATQEFPEPIHIMVDGPAG
ncbi:hypothetical protein LZ32DRAFT_614554 [Colletotrichum eremochloae]|nr:hypothetical protein LZ32DRAFT_614554 [Colletotrichum eremochloae]